MNKTMFERMEIGIFDDNDNPIREGDFVEFEADCSYSTEEGFVADTYITLGVVEYLPDEAKFCVYQFDTDECLTKDVWDNSSIKIIGNKDSHKVEEIETNMFGTDYILKKRKGDNER